MGEQYDHTPEQLHDIAERLDEVTGAEDFRVTYARKILEETADGHGDFGRAVGQVLELRSVLAGLLSYVGEGASMTVDTPGQLDRIEHALSDLVANREEMTETLTAVRDALGVKLGEVERLDRIEAKVSSVHGALVAAVQTEMTDKRAEQ